MLPASDQSQAHMKCEIRIECSRMMKNWGKFVKWEMEMRPASLPLPWNLDTDLRSKLCWPKYRTGTDLSPTYHILIERVFRRLWTCQLKISRSIVVSGILATYPQCNLWLGFQETLSQNLICYHRLNKLLGQSVTGMVLNWDFQNEISKMILPIDKNLSNIPEVHVLVMEMFHVIMHIIRRTHSLNEYPEGGISERRLMGNFGSRCWVGQSWLSI